MPICRPRDKACLLTFWSYITRVLAFDNAAGDPGLTVYEWSRSAHIGDMFWAPHFDHLERERPNSATYIRWRGKMCAVGSSKTNMCLPFITFCGGHGSHTHTITRVLVFECIPPGGFQGPLLAHGWPLLRGRYCSERETFVKRHVYSRVGRHLGYP